MPLVAARTHPFEMAEPMPEPAWIASLLPPTQPGVGYAWRPDSASTQQP